MIRFTGAWTGSNSNSSGNDCFSTTMGDLQRQVSALKDALIAQDLVTFDAMEDGETRIEEDVWLASQTSEPMQHAAADRRQLKARIQALEATLGAAGDALWDTPMETYGTDASP